MARRVFFSFHYERDIWPVNQVRNSRVTASDRETAGFFDAADREEIKLATDEKIRNWIDEQLHNTSVIAILIGNETAERDWVQYEIEKSIQRGNGVVGMRIHSLKDKEGSSDFSGNNPLKEFVVEDGDEVTRLSDLFETYDWKRDNGRENIGEWVEEAAQISEELSQEQRMSVRRRQSAWEGADVGSLILLCIIVIVLADEYLDTDILGRIDLSKLSE